MGNLGSILNMLKKVGAEAVRSSDVHVIAEAERLILPGVGAFDMGMKNLNDLGLVPVLNHRVVDDHIPLLGICLGMQLLTNESEEGRSPGLGWIDARTIKLDSGNLKIPHMGWNTTEVKQRHLIFDGLSDPRFYFVHSYHVHCNKRDNILSTTQYGREFVSSLIKENILGVQFHPEKSHKFGMRLLSNFAHLI